MIDILTSREMIAGLALVLYVAAFGIFLKWATERAAMLDPRDEAGLSDDERDELRVLHDWTNRK